MRPTSIHKCLSISAVIALCSALSVASATSVLAATPSHPTPYPISSTPLHQDISPPLASLHPTNYNFESSLGNNRGAKRLPPHGNAPRASSSASPTSSSLRAPTSGLSFDGVGQGFNGYTVCCAPPDTNASIGPNHIVEIVNLDLAVWNKSGTLLYGPVPNNTLWSGFGGGCQIDNDGDPTVLYDPQSDRWLISQFAVTTTHYLMCVAVSQTSDPTGAYFRYSYLFNDFPDYPKLGIWPDAYYLTFNAFSGGTSFNGGVACALDRSKMLLGALATIQCFSVGLAYGGLLPSSLDGTTLPPASSPNYILALETSSSLAYWKFHVDFTTPANTTLTGPISLSVTPYTPSCSTFPNGDCVPQALTTQKLDSLSDRLMYRLAYRNFGDHEALIVNHTIEVGSGTSLHSGVRWYEIRPDVTHNLSVFQQGTYAPDTNWRWMGSAAFDKAGDIALGYSVSGNVSPQIHFTGRLPSDPPGTMSQGDNTIINGAGSQTGGLSRWGDYTSMAIDPVDGCTFWYASEYLKSSGSFNWSTHLASFSLPNCANPDFSLQAAPATVTVIAGNPATYSLTVTALGSFTGTVSFSLSPLPSGASGTFSPTSVNTSGSSTLTVSTSPSMPPGSYPLTVTATSGSLSHSANLILIINPPPTPDFSLSATPTSQTVIQGSPTSYTLSLTRTNGFTGPVTFSASALPGGVNGSFSPNPASGSNSTFSLTTSSSTPSGSYSITITATSTPLSHATTVHLVVNVPPDFSLSATPTQLSIKRTHSGSYTIKVTRVGGLSGKITLSVSGLPPSTTASFSSNPVTSSSTLKLKPSSSTPKGTYLLTIKGISGGLTHTTTVTLVVT